MISTGCVCLVKTKMKYRTVEKEEIQRETGREIWVVMQRRVGCGAVGNTQDRCSERQLKHHSQTSLIYSLPLKLKLCFFHGLSDNRDTHKILD